MKRGDMLFVGASGNNGTQPTVVDGKRNSSINYSNFPGKEVSALNSGWSQCLAMLAALQARWWPVRSLCRIAPRCHCCTTCYNAVALARG
jgi:hypothetical protein